MQVNRIESSVIEAASIVVGSLKSKLTKAENELEQMQKLLEEERESLSAHAMCGDGPTGFSLSLSSPFYK